MDLVADLLPFLVAAFLLDSVALVRGGQVLFVSDWRGRFTRRGPGLRWPGLLPWAEAFVTVPLRLRLGEDAVRIVAPRGQGTRVIFRDMAPVTVEGGRVRLGPDTAIEISPPDAAPAVAELLERLRLAPPQRRPAVLRLELQDRCDLPALRRLRERVDGDAALLQGLSTALFAAIFAVAPWSLLAALPARPSPWLAAGVGLLLYGGVLLVSTALLRGAGLRPAAVVSRLLPLLIFPPAAAHAPSLVSRELLLRFEPAAAAAVLLPPASFRELARRRQAGRQLVTGQEAAEPEILDAEDVAWDLVLGSLGLSEAELLVPPAREDASADAFCPLCRAEYRSGFARCSDCDVPLQPFPA